MAVFALLLIAGPSVAAATPAQDCRSVVAKEGRKLFGTVVKARLRCLDSVAKGSLPGSTDCSVEAKAARKITKAQERLDQKIRGDCTDADVAAGSYADADACAGAGTVDDLVTCIGGSHTNAAALLSPKLGGVDLVGLSDAQKCRRQAGTRFRKVADRRIKEAQRCQDRVDEGALPVATNCIVLTEADEKLVRFDAKAEQKITAACGGGEFSPLARAEFPVPCDTDYSSRFYACVRCNLSTLTNGLLQSEGVAPESLVGLEPAAGACIPRDTTQITLTQESTATGLGFTWELEFYRNSAYECGLSGNYTFLVMNPADAPTAEAPLWVYLHGGGAGYYDELGVYQAVKDQTEDTFNHEETFTDLWDDQVLRHTLDNTNQPIDSTLKRRIEQGYRVLVVSMCDHDLYSGLGTPYTNNPVGGEVNGLQATMAAIDYTVANYPTTHVFAHGTSAGSIGVWSLASSYGFEGNPLTGGVADSWISTPRILTTAAAFAGEPGYPFGSDFDVQGISDKVGFFVREDIPAYPEAQLADRDFRDVPVLFIAGNNDPFCGGNQAPLAEAVAEGLSNCNWLHDGLRQLIDAQVDSPHELHVLNGFGHVPTNGEGPVNDIVDDFIDKVLATNPPAFGD